MLQRESRWTDEQWQAITARRSNLLVAAAAGAGKTAVLVERIIGYIREGLDVDRLLVLTFTNAAAAEMRERIREAVTKALHQEPENGHLRRQLVLLNRASITTLHSYCLELVRKHYYRLELDPSFRIADETESALLQQDGLDQVFEDFYDKIGAGIVEQEKADAFDRLLDAYGSDRDDSALQEVVRKLYERAQSQPQPFTWLQQIVNLFDQVQQQSIDDIPWFALLREDLAMDLEALAQELAGALALCQAPGPYHYEEIVQEELHQLQDLQQACKKSWLSLYEGFVHLAFKRLPSKRVQVDEARKEEVKAKRNHCKDKLRDMEKKYFSRHPNEMVKELEKLGPEMALFVELTLDFANSYQARKEEKRLLDFNDLEHKCLALLSEEVDSGLWKPSPIAKELSKHYVEVLVDEYQDINRVQETILEFLSQENRFMVGDVKQSIYRFRLAEPSLFLQKYGAFQPYEEAVLEKEKGGRKIDLAKNFRSRANILEGVNFLFQHIMTAYAGEMTYDEKAFLQSGAFYPQDSTHLGDGPIEFYLLQNKEDQEGSDEEAERTGVEGQEEALGDERNDDGFDEKVELERTQLEARLIGRRIEQLVASEYVYDKEKGTYRQATYLDIVILLRATKGRANVFVDEFRAMEIPAYAEVGSGYFEATEVSVMMALLKVIDNPSQDIPLAATLRSPLFRFTAAELATLRLYEQEGAFYEALLAYSREGGNEASLSDALLGKVLSFLQKLEKWRTLARSGPLATLIWQIYGETGFYDYVGAMVGGHQRQANLRAFYSRALQFEKTSFRGLFRFLRFIERLQDQGGDFGTARALGEKENVVRIMSIHKSKGLEFPIVFVPSLGNRFNLREGKQKLLLHKELGLGPLVLQPEGRYHYPSIAKLAIERKIYKETLAEEMRVLYVAVTRAKEKLILVGTVADRVKTAQKWCQQEVELGKPLADQNLLRASSFLDWIGPVLAAHPDGQIIKKWAEGAQDEQGAKQASGEEEVGREIARSTMSKPWMNSCWSLYYSTSRDFHQSNRTTVAEEKEQAQDKLSLQEKIEKVRAFEPFTNSEDLSPYLQWNYGYEAKAGLPVKVSISQLKNWFTRPEEPGFVDEKTLLPERQSNSLEMYFQERPQFLQKKSALSGSERGSAIHLVMQHIALAGDLSLSAIGRQIDDLVLREVLRKEQRQALSDQEIYQFFQSPLGKRLLSASTVLREVPFSLALPLPEFEAFIRSCPEAREVGRIQRGHKVVQGEEDGKGEKIVLQGVIDCLFEEKGQWILLDYKSDRQKNPDQELWLQEMKRKYRSQLDWYERALVEAWSQKPQERHIYFFSIGKALQI
ncbi:helicase-exonuclease AddAB subunit AddA [Heliorestis convoluta]|uniref:ATP-dependent helicase/nuclease subunit A n=1 Tax=Heliorestis convoluta TaxID=356322 RepID=A0A5Q2MY21_9FIRM|nr:helicase-exonuclease AddAB subunit AddA [Heliorestis convoluta]QGG47598.1 helicase-exonuclease AddAB, AddA subunit [Heliorestis convoluta]